MKVANSIREALEEEKFDLVIGTSQYGDQIKDANFSKFKNFSNVLIMFGGLDGLEGMLEEDSFRQ